MTAPGFVTAAQFGDGMDGLRAAWATGLAVICTPGMTYTMDGGGPLIAVDRSAILIGPYSIFACPDNDMRILAVSNSWGATHAVTAAIAPHGNMITVDDGSTFAPGQTYKIGSDQLAPETNDARMGEFIEVFAVSGNDITLTKNLHYPYDYTQNCVVGQLNTETTTDIQLGEIVLTPGNTYGRPQVTIQAVNDPKIVVGNVDFVGGTLVRPISCYGGYYEIGSVLRGPGGTSGYGIELAGTEHAIACVKFASNIRHAIDSGGGDVTDAVGMSVYGTSAYNKGINSFASGCYQAPFASHQGTRSHVYQNCRVVGGAAAFAFRGIGNSCVDCEAEDVPSAFGAFTQFPGSSTTDDTTLINCRVKNGTGTVISGDDGGGKITVIGGRYHVSSSATVSIVVNTDSSMYFSQGVEIIIDGTLTDRPILLETGATEFDLGDTYISFSNAGLTQLISASPGVTAVIKWNGLVVNNPNGPLHYIYGENATLPAGSILGAATILGGLGTAGPPFALGMPIKGVTDASLQPFLVGTIRDCTSGFEWRPLSPGGISGTFTPTFVFATLGNLSVAYNRQYGFYYIDNGWVSWGVRLQCTPTFTTASGAFTIDCGSLPGPIDTFGGIVAVEIGNLDHVGLPTGAVAPLAKMIHPSSDVVFQGYVPGNVAAALTTAQFTSGVSVDISVGGVYRAS